MKKLISFCLSMILVLSLAIPAAAADGPESISAAPAPDGVTVMVNGEYVTFPDGVPEVTNGRTMVPMRAVLETLGAEVNYNAEIRTVTATLGDTVLTHVIGTDQIAVKDGEVLTMDTASYVRNGSTMVPLRFFSQALGYEVYWDQGQRAAVVIDKQAIVSELDKNFTIINSAQAKQAEALDVSGNLGMKMNFSGEVKLPDSIAGGAAWPFSMDMTALYGPKAMNVEGAMDLSVLGELMTATAGEEMPQELSALLKDFSFRMIYGESMWMQMPALTALMQSSGAEVPAGEIWMSMDASEMGTFQSLYGMSISSRSGSTLGGTLYALAEFMDAEVPVNIYDDLIHAGELMTALMGDDTFTKSGEDYTWTLDQKKFGQLADALGASSVSVPGTVELTVKAGGGCDFAAELKLDEVSLTLSGSSDGAASTIQGRVQVENVCDVTFQGEAKVAASAAAPVTAPPADTVVIDLDDLSSAPLSNVGVIGGSDGPTAVFVTSAA